MYTKHLYVFKFFKIKFYDNITFNNFERVYAIFLSLIFSNLVKSYKMKKKPFLNIFGTLYYISYKRLQYDTVYLSNIFTA